jgi:hypothetical protein
MALSQQGNHTEDLRFIDAAVHLNAEAFRPMRWRMENLRGRLKTRL